jgi:hypothetical protein
MCANLIPASPKRSLQSVWTAISLSEAVAIRDWLFDPARNFNLTRGDVAEAKCVFVFPIRHNHSSAYAGGRRGPIRTARVLTNRSSVTTMSSSSKRTTHPKPTRSLTSLAMHPNQRAPPASS